VKHVAFVCAAALLLACTTSGAAATDDGYVSISIVDAPRAHAKGGYSPTTQKIGAGTWVTWSNDGEDPHTVTAVDGSFDSGELDASDGFSWYFDQPGTYEYVCSLHDWMNGKIIVS
jgi:plastocyanin